MLTEEHKRAEMFYDDTRGFSEFVKKSKFENMHWEMKKRNIQARECLKKAPIQRLEKLAKKVLNFEIEKGVKDKKDNY